VHIKDTFTKEKEISGERKKKTKGREMGGGRLVSSYIKEKRGGKGWNAFNAWIINKKEATHWGLGSRKVKKGGGG